MDHQRNLLSIADLGVEFASDVGVVNAVNGVSLSVKEKGHAIGIVGESGCGKSVTSLSVLRLLPRASRIASGRIEYLDKDGEIVNLLDYAPNSRAIRRIRGAEISMIFQEPMTAFSPVHSIGNQICESILTHHNCTKREAREQAIDLLDQVGILNPSQRVDEYPFQLSGGMRQRAMIAMALSSGPRLLIADEPTTALDVTVQAQVLNLIKEIQQKRELSLQVITHDWGVIAYMVDYVYVMYLGRIIEEGTLEEVYSNPLHPYTRDLLHSIPRIGRSQEKLESIQGSVPTSYSLPSGCFFQPRCRDALGSMCEDGYPAVTRVNEEHCVSCFKYTKEVIADGFESDK